MKKYVLPLVAFLSLSFCGCDGNKNTELSAQVNEAKYMFRSPQQELLIQEENKRKMEEAEALKFSDSDFLKTKQLMCDETIWFVDPWTGLVGDHAHDNKVYMAALERLERNLSVKDNRLVINAESAMELNMAEDLYLYLVDLIAEWNGWIKEGRFRIVKTDKGYSIDPIPRQNQ